MSLKKLGQLNPGDKAVITRVEINKSSRLLQLGFITGSCVQVMHQAPFVGDPIAVQVRGSLIALRRSEANAIEVEVK